MTQVDSHWLLSVEARVCTQVHVGFVVDKVALGLTTWGTYNRLVGSHSSRTLSHTIVMNKCYMEIKLLCMYSSILLLMDLVWVHLLVCQCVHA
jgi:hypothetical protein